MGTELLDIVYNASRCSSEYEYWGKGNDDMFNASGTYYINKTGHVVQASSYSPWNRLCAADSCMQSQRSFSNMQGGLYGLSHRLALEATTSGGPWANKKTGHEDKVTG